ncbi:MAG TPA: hypothetical protein DEQ38_00310 [Elusimicrobia bacterium]|nr:MAG: hypothetical protein A2089_12125 [Elusimicrobia bacterium GWD2_63_28]HCC46555.1 hypothetical protein [Elusimicrobiota bacterium]
MEKNMKRLILIFLALFLVKSPAFASVDWESKGMQIVGEIIANPAGFFYDFQQDLEGTTPLPPGKRFGIQTGLFPTTIPMTYTNVSAKVRLHGEGRIAPGVPQLDLIGGYWDMLAAKMATKDSETVDKAKFGGYYVGGILSTSVSPRVRTFWGYKHSVLKAKLDFKPDAQGQLPQFMGTDLNDIDTGFKDDFFIAGIETPKGIGKLWSIQLNYGLKTQVFSSKVSWYGKYFELGLNIYPEGVLVVHPVWNFHLNF